MCVCASVGTFSERFKWLRFFDCIEGRCLDKQILKHEIYSNFVAVNKSLVSLPPYLVNKR